MVLLGSDSLRTMVDELLVPLHTGPLQTQADHLDELLHNGVFTEADLSIAVQQTRFALAIRVPAYEEAVSHRHRWSLRGTLEIPMYEYRLLVEGLSGIEVHDESETYDHRIDRVAYQSENDELVIEATPTHWIKLAGASHASSSISRRQGAVGSVTAETFGPVEIRRS